MKRKTNPVSLQELAAIVLQPKIEALVETASTKSSAVLDTAVLNKAITDALKSQAAGVIPA